LASISLAPVIALKSAYNKLKKRAKVKEEDNIDKKALVAKKVNIKIVIISLTKELTLIRRSKEIYLTN
jgi:hypothetical protein